jgi:hypothetical protein
LIQFEQSEPDRGARVPGEHRHILPGIVDRLETSDWSWPIAALGAADVTSPVLFFRLGLRDFTATRLQRLAAVPEPEFEAALAGSDKPTTNGIITAAFPSKPKPVSGDALWLWGRLEEFKRQALDKHPVRFLETLTPAMQADVRDLVPRVIGWLEQMRQECQKPDR